MLRIAEEYARKKGSAVDALCRVLLLKSRILPEDTTKDQ
jgi:hypothetical protein